MKRRTVITEEARYIKVESPSWIWSSQGFAPEVIKGEVYFDVPYESEEQKSSLLEEAITTWRERVKEGYCMLNRPVAKIYWKTIVENVEEW